MGVLGNFIKECVGSIEFGFIGTFLNIRTFCYNNFTWSISITFCIVIYDFSAKMS